MKFPLSTAVFLLAVFFCFSFDVQAATYTVTNINDDGAGSLRDAVNLSNASADEDTIVFDAALFSTPQTVVLTSGQMDIKGSLNINGPGAGLLSVSGNNQSRIFFGNYSSSFVKINNLTLKHGFAPDGGAIYIANTLFLSDVVITENTAKGAIPGEDHKSSGGGVYASGGLTIVNSKVTNNLAIGVVIDNNGRYYQGDYGTQGEGGGVYVAGFNGTIINCIFSGNKAEGADAPTGGELNEGGNGGSAYGGAVAAMFDVEVINSTFADNAAIGGDGGSIRNRFVQSGDGGEAQGGAFAGRVTALNSTINNNKAIAGNTGEVLVSGGTLGLGGKAQGGGIHHGGSFVNTTIVDNKAIGGSGLKGGDAFGGGLTGGRIINSTITGNTVTAGTGTQGDGASYGGGFYDGDNSSSFYNNIIAENSAATGGPDLYGDFTYRPNNSNLIGIGDGAIGLANGVNANIVGTTAAPASPMLAPLSDNGGFTRTRALLPQSPAIDAGNKSYSFHFMPFETRLLFDQRNFDRVFPAGGAVDIGSFEFGASKLTTSSIPDLQRTSDTGINDADNITKASSVVFDISNAVPGAKVELLRDNVVVSSATVARFTAILRDENPPRDGVVQYASRQTVGEATSESSLPLSVTYDNTAPEITINQAPAQADPTTNPSIRFIVTLSEPANGIGRENISFAGSTADLTNSAVWINAVNATTYSIEITSPRSSGLIVVNIPPQAVFDHVFNRGSVTNIIDNSVDFQPGSIEVTVSGRIRKGFGSLKTPATITLTNTATGEIRTTRTTSFGYYRFSDLKVFRQIGTRFDVRINGKSAAGDFINSVIITASRNNLNYTIR